MKLLNEGNLKRYLIYAVGEILLVMIGILLALQVNNWNNESEQGKKETQILTELNRNLKLNEKLLIRGVEIQTSIVQNIDIISNHIKNNGHYHDSLGIRFAPIAYTEEFNIVNSAFESLKTIGFDIISSNILREETIRLFNMKYSTAANTIREVGTSQHRGLIIPLYLRHIEYDKKGTVVMSDYEILKKDKEFINMLSTRRIWKINLIDNYKKLIDETMQLSKMIELELNK